MKGIASVACLESPLGPEWDLYCVMKSLYCGMLYTLALNLSSAHCTYIMKVQGTPLMGI